MSSEPRLEFGLLARLEGVATTPSTVGMSSFDEPTRRLPDSSSGEAQLWVRVEKYLFGTILGIGGLLAPVVHLRMDDTGQIVRVASNQRYLREQRENRLYHKVLLRVEADQHYRTGEMRNYRLLGFEDYQPGYDEDALDRFAASGALAWADVPDAAQWVRELRGGCLRSHETSQKSQNDLILPI